MVWKKWLGRSEQQTDIKYGDLDPTRVPRHVAIIMDGNGRWAKKRGLPRTYGHRAGAEALRAIVRTTAELGIAVLTTYAFSTENWKRPAEEVDLLMNLFSDYLDNEIDELKDNDIKVRFCGQIEALAPGLQEKIAFAEQATCANTGLILNIAVNYGGRAELARAMRLIAAELQTGSLQPADIDEETISRRLYTAGLPDPDLIIRPAGDLRISNFLLWQAAYAEFWFTDTNWPDFRPEHLIAAVADFQRRDRRFGGLSK